MFLPLRTDSPLRRTPYMNWALIAANVIAFAVERSLYKPDESMPWELSPRNPHIYQFFTHLFLHANLLHLVGNMLFLYLFGNNVNDRLGHVGYLAFYLAGGVIAGTSHVFFSGTPAIGASGAISAVTGAYLVLLPRSHVTVVYFFYLIGMAEVPSIWFIVLSMAYSDLLPLLMPTTFGGDNVAHSAHLGGIAFGFLICIAMLGLRLLPRDPFDILALIQRWNRRREYRDMVSKGYNPFTYTPPPAKKADPRMGQIQDIRAEIAEAMAHHKLDEAANLYVSLLAIDPLQVLSRTAQLDIGNYLFEANRPAEAARAWELFLTEFPRHERANHVQLMLGVTYARYLQNAERAKTHLSAVLPKLHDSREIELAKEELSRMPSNT